MYHQKSRWPSAQKPHQPSAQTSYWPSVQDVLRPGAQKSRWPSAQIPHQPSAQTSYWPSIQDVLRPGAQKSRWPSAQIPHQPSAQTSYWPSVQDVLRPGAQKSLRPSAQIPHQPSAQPPRWPSVQDVLQSGAQASCLTQQKNDLLSLDKCGKTTAKFGGGGKIKAQAIKPGDFPWLAAIGITLKREKQFNAICGGTLITNRHVLSAAHCFLSSDVIKNPPSLVRLGEHHLMWDGDGAQDYRIIETHTNNYDPDTNSNDIAILKLDRTVHFKGRIAPACLPFDLPEWEYSHKRLTVVGWGMTSVSNRKYYVPMREEPEYVPLLECQQNYKFENNIITNQNICAGRGKADACQGDSGGPLNFKSSRGKNAGHVFVVGIVSHGPIMCGDASLPGVYTNVAKYEHWIRCNLN
ncbi:unnamed protein product [Meganyctiphanes norvegica]|uniref:Peptidase S1 domain-containing protein n=1 Tax=Meganyctiphanes norvegica TaxID=48144 RepID=A0AAV2R985_MEGNR